MPLSIIIPVYNAEVFVENAVESALKQSITGEVILVEDYSKDKSYEICQKLIQKYNNVKLYRTEGNSNQGAGAARNIGLKYAKYEWILFFDADDLFVENSLDSVNLSKIKADAIFFYIQMRILSPSQNLTSGYFSYTNEERIPSLFLNSNRSYTYFEYLKGASPSIIATIFNKRILIKVGYFDESLRQAEDTDFLLRMFWFNNVCFSGLQNSIAIYQIHGKNSVLNSNTMLYYNSIKNLKWITLSLYYKLPLEVLLIFYKRYLGTHPFIYNKMYIPKRIKQMLITIELPFKILKYFLQNKDKVKTTLRKNA